MFRYLFGCVPRLISANLLVVSQRESTDHVLLDRVMVGTNADDRVPLVMHLFGPMLPRTRTPPPGPIPKTSRFHGPYGQWLRHPRGYFYNTHPHHVLGDDGRLTLARATSRILPSPAEHVGDGVPPQALAPAQPARLSQDIPNSDTAEEREFATGLTHLREFVTAHIRKPDKKGGKARGAPPAGAFKEIITAEHESRWSCGKRKITTWVKSHCEGWDSNSWNRFCTLYAQRGILICGKNLQVTDTLYREEINPTSSL